MRFSPTERDGARDALRAQLEAAISPADLRAEHSDCAARVWQGLVSLGWTGATVNAAHGGLGLEFADLAILYEELGRQAAPAFVAGTMIAAEALAHDPAFGARWLPRIIAGDARIALPADFGFRSQTTLVGDDASNVAATMIEDGNRRGFMLRGIDTAQPGPPALDRTRRLFETPASGAGDIVWLTPAQWESLLDHAALAIACDAVGGSAMILEQTIAYLGVRKQFGRVIGSFQALKHRAADWKVLLEACRALTDAAFAERTPDRSSAARASGAKAYVCDAYAAIAGDAVQLHGGIGFTWEHACHIYLKRAKLNQALLGGSIAHQDRAARDAFDPEV